MSAPKFVVREFRTRRIIANVASFEAGFTRSIELYLNSGKKQSFFVEEVSA